MPCWPRSTSSSADVRLLELASSSTDATELDRLPVVPRRGTWTMQSGCRGRPGGALPRLTPLPRTRSTVPLCSRRNLHRHRPLERRHLHLVLTASLPENADCREWRSCRPRLRRVAWGQHVDDEDEVASFGPLFGDCASWPVDAERRLPSSAPGGMRSVTVSRRVRGCEAGAPFPEPLSRSRP